MATKPEEPPELIEEAEIQPDEEQEETAATEEGEEEPPEPEKEPEEETIIGFGDEADEQADDNSTIRHLREKLKEKDARLRELETAAPKPKIEIGEKPTLEACGYDEDQFEKELTSWHQRKATAEVEERKTNEANAIVQREWEQDVAAFAEKKAKLTAVVPDLDDLQQTVSGSLDGVQQAVMVKAASDPALFMVALAKNPAKLAELAKIKDPVKLGAAIARMEGGIKVVTRRRAPTPDKPQSGSSPMPGGADKQLEKLEKEADRTGDRTKLIQYRKQQQAQKSKA